MRTACLLAVALSGCVDPNDLLREPYADRVDLADMAPQARIDTAAAVPDDAAISVDLFVAPDLAEAAPDMASKCGGWVSPEIGGCWYVSAASASCNATCANHGGFDAVGSAHKGHPILSHFFPQARIWPGMVLYDVELWYSAGANPEEIVDTTGALPTGAEHFSDGRVACSCLR